MQSSRQSDLKRDANQLDENARLSHFKEIFLKCIRDYRRGPTGEICVSGRWISLRQGPQGLRRSNSIENNIQLADSFDTLIHFLYQQIVDANKSLVNRGYKRQAYDAANYFGMKAYDGFAWGFNSLASKAGFNTSINSSSHETDAGSESLEGSKQLLKEMVKSFDYAIGSGYHGEVNVALTVDQIFTLNAVFDDHISLRLSEYNLNNELLQPISKEFAKDVSEEFKI